MRDVSIYALLDPRDGSARYVGQSTRPYLRIEEHAYDGLAWIGGKRAWVAELQSANLRPEMIVLETFPYDRELANRQEYRWIVWFIQQGAKLLNDIAQSPTFIGTCLGMAREDPREHDAPDTLRVVPRGHARTSSQRSIWLAEVKS